MVGSIIHGWEYHIYMVGSIISHDSEYHTWLDSQISLLGVFAVAVASGVVAVVVASGVVAVVVASGVVAVVVVSSGVVVVVVATDDVVIVSSMVMHANRKKSSERSFFSYVYIIILLTIKIIISSC